jgi:hypothetical protein
VAKTGRDWTHSEYGDFWNLVIAKKCRTLYFNEGWQFSNSCTSAYLSGLKAQSSLITARTPSGWTPRRN